MDALETTLALALAAGDRPVCIGYFDAGPTPNILQVSVGELQFGQHMPPRFAANLPRPVLNGVRIVELHRAGKTAEDIAAIARREAPNWVSP